VHAGMVVIGDKLGLYKALAAGPMTSGELAAQTRTDERYVREWLSSQAAGGYVTYDAEADKFSLTEEQAFALAVNDSPAYLPGAFELALGSLNAVPRITEAFRTGARMGWHEHDSGVFHGCEKFFRPGYVANLVSAWIPALEGVKEKLEAGARVADVGSGQGASTVLMAQAFPMSRFFGFDYHEGSIEAARKSPLAHSSPMERTNMPNTPPLHGGIARDPSQSPARIRRRHPSAPELPRSAYRSSRLTQIVAATLQAVGDLVRRMVARSKRRQQARATYLALRGLDARTLRDLGFDRSEILSVAAEVAGDADSTRVRSAQARRGLPF
jgi:uncharacterized protein YjiS (DUF1127 family)